MGRGGFADDANMQALQTFTRPRRSLDPSQLTQHYSNGGKYYNTQQDSHRKSAGRTLQRSVSTSPDQYHRRRHSQTQSGTNVFSAAHKSYSHPALSQLQCGGTDLLPGRDFMQLLQSQVRASKLKFRSRQSAKRRRNRSGEPQAPSAMIKGVLDNCVEISHHPEATGGETFWALVFAWFFRFCIDVYYSISEDGRERAFWKWILSAILVSCGAILVSFLIAIMFYGLLNFVLVPLANASLSFFLLLFTVLFVVLGSMAIINFD